MRLVFITVILAIPLQGVAAAQQGPAMIAIESAVANLIDNPAGSREIGLKEKLSTVCNTKPTCSQQGSDLVDDRKFLIEVIYSCRAPDGSARQKGPVQIKGHETLTLSCAD